MNAIALDIFDRLPQQMRAASRWLLWKSIEQVAGKKPRKVPFYADGAPRSGQLDTPDDWAKLVTFDVAVSALARGAYAGLGFALGPDGSGKVWQGIDLDGIRERVELHDLARQLPGYVEASPSGNGLHAIGYGRPFRALGSNSTGIEAYSAGRFFTVTGKCLGPATLVDLSEFVIAELHHRHDVLQSNRDVDSAILRPPEITTPTLLDELRDALQHIEADDYNTWTRMGHALKTLGEDGRQLWHDWSDMSAKYDAVEAEAKWQSFKPERTSYRAVFAEALRRGWRYAAASSGRALVGPETQSEEGLALTFARENEAGLRYCAVWGQWLAWDGQRWVHDKTLLALDLVRDLCRRASENTTQRSSVALGAAHTIFAIERLARTDRRLAATADQWDIDPWLLNTPGGVVDLRTGQLRPSDPALHMTKVTAVTPALEAQPPATWLRFLDRITDHDLALQAYIQRVLGYALTGDTSAHALFFCFGTGANGKSVLIDTAAGILGDYHKTAPIETFTERGGERHPTELAMLQGARLVTAAETEEGRRWADSRIKTLTGGDRIAARFMRQDFFEYTPQFKLLVAGNHRPGLRSVDEAMRRRFHLIPFAVTIPPEERDAGLKDKLREEWPAILAWMIAGCREWQRIGLAPPPAVLAATDAYLDGEDALAAWLEDSCVVDLQAFEPIRDLFTSWKSWAERNGELAGTTRRLSQVLEARGFVPGRTPRARGMAGLRLKPIEIDG